MKLDRKAIETISVNKVKECIVVSPFLDQFITENDKEPSWDGHIYLYTDGIKNKEHFKGRIPVQIKGTVKEDFSKSIVSFSMSLNDLNCYLYDGGCILFVVYIKPDGLTSKIYYSELTPVKLKHLIDSSNGKKTKIIKLKELPADKDLVANVFFNCYQNCKKQSSFSDKKLYTLSELMGSDNIEGFVIPFEGVNIKDPTQALMESEVYLYAKLKNTDVLQPLYNMLTDLVTKQTRFGSVKIDGVNYYNSYSIIYEHNSITFSIGQSFTIKASRNAKTSEITYKDAKTLRTLVVDLSFMIAYLEGQDLEIDGNHFPIIYDKTSITKFNINDKKQLLHDAKRYVELLDFLCCKVDLPLDSFKESTIRNLDYLAAGLLNNEPIHNLKKDLPPIVYFTVCDIKFLLAVQIVKEIPGTYRIYDFFKTDIRCITVDEDGIRREISQFAVLKPNDMYKIGNLQVDNFLSSFKKTKAHDKTFQYANDFMLELLKGYDNSIGQCSDLLEAAIEFAQWIYNQSDDSIDYQVKTINLFQAIKRKRNLDDDEKNTLWEIVEISGSDKCVKVAAYLLLDQYDRANRLFTQLNDAEKNRIIEYPIYHFMKVCE